MSYFGDILLGQTIDIKFCTVTTTGAPTQLGSSPVVSAYPSNSTTQITAGITLTVDFDGVTGLNNVRVVPTVANGYAATTTYALVITAGSVGGTSVVGYVVGTFSISNRSSVSPSTRTDTAQAGAATTITLDASASAVNDFYNNQIIVLTGGTGVGQARMISDYVGSTKVATIDGAWATNPDSTSVFALLPFGAHPDITSGLVNDAAILALVSSLFSRTGTAQAGAAGTITLDASASAVDDYYNYQLVAIASGLGAGQVRFISDYVGSTKVASVGRNWATNPDSTSVFVTINFDQVTGTAPTATENADALLKRDMSAVTGESARSPLNALRLLRNKWDVAAGTLTVKKEDDSTTAWSGSITSSAGANPIIGNDPS